MKDFVRVFIVLAFVGVLPVSLVHAQEPGEQEEELTPIVYAPWNSHDFSPGLEWMSTSPSEELLSSYTNVAVTSSPAYQTECSIAINPIDSLNMLVETIDGDRGPNGMFVSRDGGVTWTESLLPPEPSNGFLGDPWVTFDAQGVAYCCGLENNSAGKMRLIVHRSSDNGQSWSIATHMMDYGSLDTVADEPVLAVDRNPGSPYFNSLYAISASDGQIPLLGQGPIGIHLQSLRAGQTTLSGQVKTSQIGLAQVPHLTFGLHGEIYIAYIGITNIATLSGALYFNRSTDGGLSWSNDQVIASSSYTDTIKGFPRVGFPAASRMGPTPRIVMDTSNGPRRGWLYVSYAMPSSADHKHNLDIYLQRSTDNGASWSTATRVNDDPISSQNDQLTPAMAINPDGVLGIVFYDRRDDANNYMLHTYIAISRDGGTTWKNDRVSSAATDPIAARKQISLSVADYISIAATRSAFFPIWNDGRQNNGDLNIYTARVPLGVSSVAAKTSEASRMNLSLYPNPASGAIHVIALDANPLSAQVYDVLGRCVLQANGLRSNAGAFTLDLRSLSPGSYRLVVEHGLQRGSVQFNHIR